MVQILNIPEPRWFVLVIFENGSRAELEVQAHGMEDAQKRANALAAKVYGDQAEDAVVTVEPIR